MSYRSSMIVSIIHIRGLLMLLKYFRFPILVTFMSIFRHLNNSINQSNYKKNETDIPQASPNGSDTKTINQYTHKDRVVEKVVAAYDPSESCCQIELLRTQIPSNCVGMTYFPLWAQRMRLSRSFGPWYSSLSICLIKVNISSERVL
jgi:hypothetical protein